MEPLLAALHVGLLLAAAGATTALAIAGWRNRGTPGALPFVGLMVALSVWTVTYVIGLTLHPGDRILWEQLQWIGIVFVPISFLAFALDYVGYSDRLLELSGLTSIPALVMLVLVWTNPIHQLVWPTYTIQQSGGVLLVAQEFGLAYWAFLAYAYTLVGLGSILLIRVAITSEYLYIDQAVLLLVGVLVPLVGNAISVLGPTPLPGIDLTPYAFTVTGIAFGNALFRYRLFERVPASWQLGRASVVGTLQDGVLVVDTDRTIVYCNDEAADIFDIDPTTIVGTSIDGFLDTDTLSLGPDQAHVELTRNSHTYELRASPVRDRHDRRVGHTIIINDITERTRYEAQLERQRDDLLLATRLNDLLRDINEILVTEHNRDTIFEGVANRFVASPLYDAAWAVDETLVNAAPALDTTDTTGQSDGGTVAEGRFSDGHRALSIPEDSPAIAVRGTTENGSDPPPDADGVWTTVPVVHNHTAYGSIVIFTTRDDAYDDRELGVLDALGRQIGHAINAVEQEQLLTADTITELEITATDTDPLAVASADADCTLTVAGLVPAADDAILAYLTVEDITADTVITALETHPTISSLRQVDDTTIECRVGPDSLIAPFHAAGAHLDTITADHGTITLIARVPPDTDIRAIMDRVQDTIPTAELQAKRQRETPIEDDVTTIPDDVIDQLTDRQRETLEAAYTAGYFEWPRESTAEDVADAMGVTSPTVHNHLRKAENELLGTLLNPDDTTEHPD